MTWFDPLRGYLPVIGFLLWYLFGALLIIRLNGKDEEEE